METKDVDESVLKEWRQMTQTEDGQDGVSLIRPDQATSRWNSIRNNEIIVLKTSSDRLVSVTIMAVLLTSLLLVIVSFIYQCAIKNNPRFNSLLESIGLQQGLGVRLQEPVGMSSAVPEESGPVRDYVENQAAGPRTLTLTPAGQAETTQASLGELVRPSFLPLGEMVVPSCLNGPDLEEGLLDPCCCGQSPSFCAGLSETKVPILGQPSPKGDESTGPGSPLLGATPTFKKDLQRVKVKMYGSLMAEGGNQVLRVSTTHLRGRLFGGLRFLKAPNSPCLPKECDL